MMIPQSQKSAFQLRDKVDLIVYFDDSSTSISEEHFVSLVNAIYDFEFEFMPKKIPVFLPGGISPVYEMFPEGFNDLSATPESVQKSMEISETAETIPSNGETLGSSSYSNLDDLVSNDYASNLAIAN